MYLACDFIKLYRCERRKISGKKCSPNPSSQIKKDIIKSKFYNGTDLTLRGLAKKYKTSYQNVCNIHADFLQETE